jgi:hypothetical protein
VKKTGFVASIIIGLSWLACSANANAQAAVPAPAPTPTPGITNPAWLTPMAPFRIADNLYYVGSQDLASYLIVTPQGDILINSSFVESVPLIRASVEQLGFRFKDIKILLISHAHSDHDAGSADIVKQTGAQYMVMDGDVPVVESGGAKDFAYPQQLYPIAKVDRVLHDGDEVKLGNVVLVAHKTPGHTRGCTTWTLKVKQGKQMLNAVIDIASRHGKNCPEISSWEPMACTSTCWASCSGSSPVPALKCGSILWATRMPWLSAKLHLQPSSSARKIDRSFVLGCRAFSSRHGLSQDELDLRIHTAQIVGRPFLDFFP